jgi:hypothetical protein
MTDNPIKRTRAAVCPIKTVARQLVIERGRLGVTNQLVRAQVPGRGTVAVGTVLAKMTRAGELTAAKVAGHLVHWFASPELAWRWEADATPKPPPTPTTRQQVPMARTRSAPVHVPRPASRIDQPAVIPAGLAPQRAAALTYDPRYQCAPGEQPFGAGFAAVGIGRDVDTGRTWGQA